MGKIKKILENELTGGNQSTEVYPVTSIKAVYDENNERLDNIIDRKNNEIQKELEVEVARATNAESNLRETINNITEVNENATSANIVTIETIPNTSSSNVQQALNELYEVKADKTEVARLDEADNEIKEKMSDITREIIEEQYESIDIYPNNDSENTIFHLDENGLDAKNVKSNGKDVLTEHQDISGLATKEELESNKTEVDGRLTELETKSEEIHKETIDTEDDFISIEDVNGNEVLHIDENGLDAKNIKSNGESIITSQELELYEKKLDNLERQDYYKIYEGSDIVLSDTFSYDSTLNGKEYLTVTNGSVNDIFCYPHPVEVDSGYPYNRVVQSYPVSLGSKLSFMYDGTQLEIIQRKSDSISVVVDGYIIGKRKYTNPDLSQDMRILLTLGEPKLRKIEIGWYNRSITGIKADDNGVVSKINNVDIPKFNFCFDGDSVVEGSSGGTTALNCITSWVGMVSHILGVNMRNCGVGGSGFIRQGNQNQPNMVDRFESYIGVYPPDVLVVAAGLNDSSENEEDIQNAVDNYFNKATKLGCRIIVVSPWCPAVSPSVNVLKVSEILRKVSLKYELPYIDAIHGLTYDALGNLITNNIGSINNHNFITEENIGVYMDVSTDPTHPTQAGHMAFGKFIANEIHKILSNFKGYLN